MNCEKCQEQIQMKYETNVRGFQIGYYWCYICQEKSTPKKDIKPTITPDLSPYFVDGDYYDWFYD